MLGYKEFTDTELNSLINSWETKEILDYPGVYVKDLSDKENRVRLFIFTNENYDKCISRNL